MNPRQMETEVRKRELQEFMCENYRVYYGRLIFVPKGPNGEFMEDASRMWLIKNNIEPEITL